MAELPRQSDVGRPSDVFVISVVNSDGGGGIVHAVYTDLEAALADAESFALTCQAMPGEEVLLEGFLLNQGHCDAEELLRRPCARAGEVGVDA